MREITVFFHTSAKQTSLLQACLDSKKGIKEVCPSRWVECHASIIRFTELLEPIVTALEKISVQRDESGTRATSLLQQFVAQDLSLLFMSLTLSVP